MTPTAERDEAHQDLSDELWARLKQLLPSRKPPTGQPGIDHRKVVNGILWVRRNGSSWRQLPERFGAWANVSGRFHEWRSTGLWGKIVEVIDGASTDASG